MQCLAVRHRPLVLVGNAQFERRVALLQGIEMGLQAHEPPPLKDGRNQHGNPIDMGTAIGESNRQWDSVSVARLC